METGAANKKIKISECSVSLQIDPIVFLLTSTVAASRMKLIVYFNSQLGSHQQKYLVPKMPNGSKPKEKPIHARGKPLQSTANTKFM